MPSADVERARIVKVFGALADPTRLAVVERLSIGPESTSGLARPFDMALPSFVEHLAVLDRAGIVTSHKTGRVRVYQLAPGALDLATTWLSGHRPHWERRLDQLDQLLLDTDRAAPNPPTKEPSS